MLLLLCSGAEAKKCPISAYFLIELVTAADLIIGIELSQSQRADGSYKVDSIYKGNQQGNYLPAHYLRHAAQPLQGHYALIFLSEVKENSYAHIIEGKKVGFIEPLFASNSVITFDRDENKELAISRFTKLLTIEKLKNQKERQMAALNWLIDGIELAEIDQATTNYYQRDPTNVEALDHAFDALVYLEMYSLKELNDDDRFYVREYGFIDLNLITTEQKTRIFTVFEKAMHPETRLVTLVEALGYVGLNTHLLQVVETLLEERNLDIIWVYEEILIQQKLTTQEETVLAKLILFHLRVYKLRDFRQKTYWDWSRKGNDILGYIANYLGKESQFLFTWKHTKPKKKDQIVSTLVTEAQQVLNMCEDERIIRLTGTQKLWDCL